MNKCLGDPRGIPREPRGTPRDPGGIPRPGPGAAGAAAGGTILEQKWEQAVSMLDRNRGGFSKYQHLGTHQRQSLPISGNPRITSIGSDTEPTFYTRRGSG